MVPACGDLKKPLTETQRHEEFFFLLRGSGCDAAKREPPPLELGRLQPQFVRQFTISEAFCLRRTFL